MARNVLAQCWKPGVCLVLLAGAGVAALAQSGGPATSSNEVDVGFERYVDPEMLASAWDAKDAELLTDLALQIAEGERILLRPRRGISADQALHVAALV